MKEAGLILTFEEHPAYWYKIKTKAATKTMSGESLINDSDVSSREERRQRRGQTISTLTKSLSQYS
jgi:hypothetical protein